MTLQSHPAARSPRAPGLGHGKPGRVGAEIWAGIGIVAALVLVFLVAAALIPLDSAAYGVGQIVVSGHRQTVQHREGGVVQSLTVKDGDHVAAGQVLLTLSGGDVEAAERSLQAQVIGLQAERARLQAEQGSAANIAWPLELTAGASENAEAVQRAMAVQTSEFSSRAIALEAHKAVLRERVGELAQQMLGYQRELQATARQRSLIAEELTSMKSLADQGYAPMSQVRALERNQADLEGRVGQYDASTAQSQQQMAETRLQSLQLDTDRKEEVAKQLRDVQFQLDELAPKLQASRDQLARVRVRAPSSGRVVGLSIFTVGGVIAPGQKLMDIVPDDAPLVIEAQLAPGDANGLKIGQITEVRLDGGRDRTLPILKGALTGLSADSLNNEKTGAPFFTAEVTIPQDQLKLLDTDKAAAALRPGLPVQVVIPTGKRTALQYIVEPLSRTLWRSFRER